MKEKILSELKTKYKNLGLSDETYEGVANQLALSVKEETEIATAVTGAEGLLKSIQKYADSRVTSVKTEADTLKKKLEEMEKGGKKDEPGKKEGDDTPEWAKSLIKANEDLKNDLLTLKGEKVHESLHSTLISALSEKKIPEAFYSPAILNRTFSKKEDVDTIVEAVTANYDKFQQSIANTGGVIPEQGKGKVEKDVVEVAKMIENGTKDITNNQNK